MTRKIISTGSTANDGSGDTLRDAMDKVNDNFEELYTASGTGGLEEAPEDSEAYVRLNASWVTIDSAGTVTNPTDDGNLYARSGATWTQIPNNIEAPENGLPYVRKDATWVRGILEANSDGSRYVRVNGSWEPIVTFPDAPADGNSYLRKDSSWIADSSISDAPNDGAVYARQSQDWLDITDDLGGLAEAPEDGAYYLRRNAGWTNLDSSVLTAAVGSIWENAGGGTGTVDSAATIQLITTNVDSAYVQARQIIGGSSGVDSAAVTGLIDSSYVQARQIIGGVGGVDSAAVTGLVDSAYVQARQIIGGVGGVDSAATIQLITTNVDSAYVQARQIIGGVGGVDSDAVISLIDSDYVQARQIISGGGPGGGLDSDGVLELLGLFQVSADSDVVLTVGTGGTFETFDAFYQAITSKALVATNSQISYYGYLFFNQATNVVVKFTEDVSIIDENYYDFTDIPFPIYFQGPGSIAIPEPDILSLSFSNCDVYINTATIVQNSVGDSVELTSVPIDGFSGGTLVTGEYQNSIVPGDFYSNFIAYENCVVNITGLTFAEDVVVSFSGVRGSLNSTSFYGTTEITNGSNLTLNATVGMYFADLDVSRSSLFNGTFSNSIRIAELTMKANSSFTMEGIDTSIIIGLDSDGAGANPTAIFEILDNSYLSTGYVDIKNNTTATIVADNSKIYLKGDSDCWPSSEEIELKNNAELFVETGTVGIASTSDDYLARISGQATRKLSGIPTSEPADSDILYITPSGYLGLSNNAITPVSAANEYKFISLIAPTDSDEFAFSRYPVETTVNKIVAVITGGDSCNFSIRYGTDRSSGGTEVITGGTSVSSTTTGDSESSFDNGVIPANSWIWVDVNSVAGSVEELNISIEMEQ